MKKRASKLNDLSNRFFFAMFTTNSRAFQMVLLLFREFKSANVSEWKAEKTDFKKNIQSFSF